MQNTISSPDNSQLSTTSALKSSPTSWSRPPSQPAPRSRQRTRFSLVFALTALFSSNVLAAPCAHDDLACLRASLLEQADEVGRLSRQLEGYKRLEANSQEQIKNLLESNAALSNALKPALDAVRGAQPKFYQTVEFGLAIGVPVGVLVTVLSGLAIAYAARQLVVLR